MGLLPQGRMLKEGERRQGLPSLVTLAQSQCGFCSSDRPGRGVDLFSFQFLPLRVPFPSCKELRTAKMALFPHFALTTAL